MFNKELKERVKLLEYENEILAHKIDSILHPKEKGMHKKLPKVLKSNMYYGNGEMNYRTLRMKYRSFEPVFNFD